MDYAQKDADIIFWPDQPTPRFKLVYPLEMQGNTSGSFQGKYSSPRIQVHHKDKKPETAGRESAEIQLLHSRCRPYDLTVEECPINQ